MTNPKQIDWNDKAITREDIIEVWQRNTGLFVKVARKYRNRLENSDLLNGFFVFMFDENKRWNKFDPARSSILIEKGMDQAIINFLGWYARSYFYTHVRTQARRFKHERTSEAACITERLIECESHGYCPLAKAVNQDQIRHTRMRLSDRQKEIWNASIRTGGNHTMTACACEISTSRVRATMNDIHRVARVYQAL